MFRIEPGQEKHIESIHRAYDVVAREGLYFAETEAIRLDHLRQWMDVAIQLNCPQVVALSREDVIGWSIAHRTDEPFTLVTAARFSWDYCRSGADAVSDGGC